MDGFSPLPPDAPDVVLGRATVDEDVVVVQTLDDDALATLLTGLFDTDGPAGQRWVTVRPVDGATPPRRGEIEEG